MLTGRFEQAIRYAAAVHGHQVRKGTQIPYLQHLLGAASNALRYGADEDEAIAALLHDAAEDGGGEGRLEDIARRFGPAVEAIVRGCSDTVEADKPPWKERKAAYLRHLAEAPVDVLLVSACDKIDNARAIVADLRRHGDELWKRFNVEDPAQQLWYYRSLVDTFEQRRGELEARHAAGAIDELRGAVDEMGRLAGV